MAAIDFIEESSIDFQEEETPAFDMANYRPSAEQEAQLKMGMRAGPLGAGTDTEFLSSVASDPGGFISSLPGAAVAPFSFAGKGAYLGAADLMSLISEPSGRREFGGNLPVFISGDPTKTLPVERFLAETSETSPNLTALAKFGRTATEMAPLGILGRLPAWAQQLVAAGFSIEMIRHAPALFEEYATEINKPESEQDQNRLSSLKSDIAMLGFAPLLAAKPGASAIGAAERATLSRFPQLAPGRALGRAIEEAPLLAESRPIDLVDPAAREALRLPDRPPGPMPIPEAAETARLIDQAFREQQSGIVPAGEIPALEKLRRQFEPQIQVLSELEGARAVEQRPGGGPAQGGQISFAAEAGPEAIPSARQKAQTQITEAPNAIQESRQEQVRQPVGPEVQQEAGGSVLRDRGLEAPRPKEEGMTPEKSLPPSTEYQGEAMGRWNFKITEGDGAGANFSTVAGATPEQIAAARARTAEAFRTATEMTPYELERLVEVAKKGAQPKVPSEPKLPPAKLTSEEAAAAKAAGLKIVEPPSQTKPTIDIESEPAPPKSSTAVFPSLYVKSGKVLTQVTPEQASKLMTKVRDRADLGASQLGDLKLYDQAGNEVAFVSYNGNVWLGKSGQLKRTASSLIYNRTGLVWDAKTKTWSLPKPKPTTPRSGIVKKLESLKFKEGMSGELYTLRPDVLQAIGKSAWNTGIDIAIASVKAGKSIKVAVQNALDHIRRNAKGAFDIEHVRSNLESILQKEIATPVQKAEPVATLTREAAPSGSAADIGPERMRNLSARATEAETVPPPVQERIAGAPESFYQQQRVQPREEAPGQSVVEIVSSMSDAELAAVPRTSNLHTGSQLELSKRLFDAGKLEEGYQLLQSLSEGGTLMGQLINQFKLLQGANPLHVVEIVNQGLKQGGKDPLTKAQMQKLAESAEASIQANRKLDAAKRQWEKEPTDANATAADRALAESNKAELATQREINKYRVPNWPQMLKSFAQGNPLTPISHVANTVGNVVGAAMEGSARGVAIPIDIIRSALTGAERKVGRASISQTAKGFGRGLAQGPGVLLRGTGDTIKGESRTGLHPLKAWKKVLAKQPEGPTVGGKVPLNERIRLATEATFGVAPETMLRLLSAADKPSYEAARSRLISEQVKLHKLPPERARMAQNFPELVFSPEVVTRIQREAADAIFQRDSQTIQTLQRFVRRGGDWADLAFTLAVAPYKLTPFNLVVRTLKYNPLVALAEMGLKAKRGDVRGAELAAGRMIVGLTLYTAGYELYRNQLIGPALDERDESQKSRLLAGEILPPNHVNLDGMKRWVKGEDPAFKPGDQTTDLTRGGGAAGAVLMSVANVMRSREKEPQESGAGLVGQLFRDSVLEQANFTIQQSFLKGVTGILEAVQNRNLDRYIDSLENMVLNVGTPNTLSALSRATRPFVPDFKEKDISKEFENVIRNRFGILGADDYLPVRRDLWGEPMKQTPEGRNALLYHLFDISKGKQVTDDPVALEQYRLWRKTANSRVIQSIPERQIEDANKVYPLNGEQYSRYAQLVGNMRRQMADRMIANPKYWELNDEEKIRAFSIAFDHGLQEAKRVMATEYPNLQPKAPRAGFR